MSGISVWTEIFFQPPRGRDALGLAGPKDLLAGGNGSKLRRKTRQGPGYLGGEGNQFRPFQSKDGTRAEKASGAKVSGQEKGGRRLAFPPGPVGMEGLIRAPLGGGWGLQEIGAFREETPGFPKQHGVGEYLRQKAVPGPKGLGGPKGAKHGAQKFLGLGGARNWGAKRRGAEGDKKGAPWVKKGGPFGEIFLF